MEKELTIGELHNIYQKYGDLGFKVDTPFGFKDIEWCGITEENADIYRCELENGMYVEGADYHKLKHENGDFIHLKESIIGLPIQTISGISKIKSIELMDFKDTLYDIQVAEVHQYYTNGIISHNTTLTIDGLKFLLHGNTTKTDKNEEVFNQFSGKNELFVRGMLDVSGEEIIIDRRMKRTEKKGGGWTITSKVNYYKLLPDGTEELLNDEDSKKTTQEIRLTVGSEKDFEMLVLATEKNLEDLIGLTTTESGRVLTRLIGLELVEKKEEIVRKMYNEFDKKKISNTYNQVQLLDEITQHGDKILLGEEIKNGIEEKIQGTKEEIISLQNENDKLLNSKITIDVNISTLNPSKLEEEINTITIKGTELKEKLSEITLKISGLGTHEFDENKHHELTNENNNLTISIGSKKNDVMKNDRTIKSLVDSGVCSECKRALEGIDNQEHIEKYKQLNIVLNTDIEKLENRQREVSIQLIKLNQIKKIVDEKNKLDLDKDRIGVELDSLRNKLMLKKTEQKQYKLNQDSIEFNKKIDGDVENVKTKLLVSNRLKDELMIKLQNIINDIDTNKKEIINKNLLIDKIVKEAEVDKIFRVYMDLIGKKGISKLVLRSVLPIINSEIQRLLEDVCDFEVEIFIDDKNDVKFLLNKDGVSKPLKSGSGFEKTAASLALRCVLGKVSTLQMPNFIIFDEVLGKVANENMDKLKNLFDKIKNMYEIVLLITHNDIVRDWSDNVLTIKKDNNISQINLN